MTPKDRDRLDGPKHPRLDSRLSQTYTTRRLRQWIRDNPTPQSKVLTKYAETVINCRKTPPRVGSLGQAYRLGFAGEPNRLFVRGSLGAAAYRAGVLNRKAQKAHSTGS